MDCFANYIRVFANVFGKNIYISGLGLGFGLGFGLVLGLWVKAPSSAENNLRTRRTFIIRITVFIAIITIMKYSNGDDTTRRQT